MKILYLEDNQSDVELTIIEFKKNAPHIEVDSVNSIKKSESRLSEADKAYDLVLMDMHLPDGNGLGHLEWIRENEIPVAVVIITGHGDEETAVASLKAGADDYIPKAPGYLTRLPVILENALNNYRAEEAKKSHQLRLLYVEDNMVDIDLTRRHLSRYAPHIRMDVMQSAQEVIALLSHPVTRHQYDVLLLDHRLKGLNAIDVMKELNGFLLSIPIILVTGHGDEEIAVQALKLGASDYVVKSSDYLYHLPSVIENAFNRHQLINEQEALRTSEERFRRISENAQDIIARYTFFPVQGYEYISPAVSKILGYSQEEFYQDPGIDSRITHPDDTPVTDLYRDVSKVPDDTISIRLVHKDGQIVWADYKSVPIYDHRGNLIALESIIRDISERKQDEEHIQQQMDRISAMLTIDNAISGSLDLNLTLNIVLEHVLTQLHVDATTILLLNPHTQKLHFFASRGYFYDDIKKYSMQVGSNFASRAILERKMVHTNNPEDFTNPELFNPFIVKENFVSCYSIPLISKGVIKGILEVFSRSFQRVDHEWVDYLTMLASQTAIAIDNAELFENLQKTNADLIQAYDRTLEGWVHAMDLRDKETEGHSQRVAEITLKLAARVKVRNTDLEHIRRGALLHDVGKMGIPDSILLKPGPLSEDEWQIMRKHPVFAVEMLSSIEYLRKSIDIPQYHHEQWDGSGYPNGLAGDDIPIAARIFSVVDVWDALTSDRPYRAAWEKSRAKQYIIDRQGTQFDPIVVAEFVTMLETGVIH